MTLSWEDGVAPELPLRRDYRKKRVGVSDQIVLLSFSNAMSMVNTAIDRATVIGVPMCLAVVDEAGEAIISVRMDGAPRIALGVALDKAATASRSGLDTARWADELSRDARLALGLQNVKGFLPLPGGVGLRIGDRLIGAVGASGGSAVQDQDVAVTALKGFDKGFSNLNP